MSNDLQSEFKLPCDGPDPYHIEARARKISREHCEDLLLRVEVDCRSLLGVLDNAIGNLHEFYRLAPAFPFGEMFVSWLFARIKAIAGDMLALAGRYGLVWTDYLDSVALSENPLLAMLANSMPAISEGTRLALRDAHSKADTLAALLEDAARDIAVFEADGSSAEATKASLAVCRKRIFDLHLTIAAAADAWARDVETSSP